LCIVLYTETLERPIWDRLTEYFFLLLTPPNNPNQTTIPLPNHHFYHKKSLTIHQDHHYHHPILLYYYMCHVMSRPYSPPCLTSRPSVTQSLLIAITHFSLSTPLHVTLRQPKPLCLVTWVSLLFPYSFFGRKCTKNLFYLFITVNNY